MKGIVPKPISKEPAWLDWLFYASLVLVFIALLSYFILDSSLKNSEKTLNQINQEIENQETLQLKELEKEVLGYQTKINRFSSLLPYHKKPLNFFLLLEGLCLPRVQFTNLKLEPGEDRAALSGRADSFEAVGQQIYLFQKEPLVKKISLDALLLAKEGGVDFAFDLILDPQTFRR